MSGALADSIRFDYEFKNMYVGPIVPILRQDSLIFQDDFKTGQNNVPNFPKRSSRRLSPEDRLKSMFDSDSENTHSPENK